MSLQLLMGSSHLSWKGVTDKEAKVPGGRQSSGLQAAGQCSFPSSTEKAEGSGCGGDGKALKMFIQRYDVVWTTWAF